MTFSYFSELQNMPQRRRISYGSQKKYKRIRPSGDNSTTLSGDNSTTQCNDTVEVNCDLEFEHDWNTSKDEINGSKDGMNEAFY